MRKEVLYSLKGIYRENFEIEGYRFGKYVPSAAFTHVVLVKTTSGINIRNYE